MVSISECYDPAFDKWEIVGEMGSSRSWLSCVGLTVKMDSGTTSGEEKSWRWGISVSNPVQMAATRRPPRTSGSSNEARGPHSHHHQETQQPLVIPHEQPFHDGAEMIEEDL